MKMQATRIFPIRTTMRTCAVALALLAGFSLAHAAAGRTFATPEDAGAALLAAARAHDSAALVEIFGKGSDSLVITGDSESDQALQRRFAEAYQRKHEWNSWEEGSSVLSIGKREWPFPIPLVQTPQGWHFDVELGRQEILRRSIGRNELSAIQACLAFVDAEREYWERNPMGGTPQYASRLASSPGGKDGLFWPAEEGEAPSPLGPIFAQARVQAGEGGADAKPGSFHGYRYRILMAQGDAANGGAMDYIEDGSMTRGFALLAWPAEYGASGVMTFMVNQTGVVYEKDLGDDTGEKVAKIQLFDPDVSWGVVTDASRSLPEPASGS